MTNDDTPGGLASTEGLAALVEKRCPCTRLGLSRRSCCDWTTFLQGFADAWPRWFDAPPTDQQWQQAERDWQAGNTGWEAAHNAQRRVKDRVQKREHEAWASANGVLAKAARG